MKWLETSAPGPPDRHSYRFERDWEYLAERLTASTSSAPSDVRLDPAALPALYRRMRLIRGFEDLIQSLFLRGEIYGTTHLYSGQEAVAVGFASVLGERDRVAATYRGHGHALALGVDPQELLDEMLGRATGHQRRPRRLDERHLAERPPDRLLRHRRRQHRRGDRARRSR